MSTHFYSKASTSSNIAYDAGDALRLRADGGGAHAKIRSSMFTDNHASNHGGAIHKSMTFATYTILGIDSNYANVDGNVANSTSTIDAGGFGVGIVGFKGNTT